METPINKNCRYCNKDISIRRTADFTKYGYGTSTRICECKGIDPLNEYNLPKKLWTVCGGNYGHIIGVTRFQQVKRDATFSDDKKYRFSLNRVWETESNKVLFIMINPSTASNDKDDRTIKKIMEISDNWNFGGLYVGNLYPYIDSKPGCLNTIVIPAEIQAQNQHHISEMAANCDKIVYAWGTKGPNKNQKEPEWLKTLFSDRDIYCINTSVKGVPLHPNQWSSNSKPIPSTPNLYRSKL